MDRQQRTVESLKRVWYFSVYSCLDKEKFYLILRFEYLVMVCKQTKQLVNWWSLISDLKHMIFFSCIILSKYKNINNFHSWLHIINAECIVGNFSSPANLSKFEYLKC